LPACSRIYASASARLLEHLGVIDCHGGLIGKQLQQAFPFGIQSKGTAIEDLQHPFQLSLGYQRRCPVGLKTFLTKGLGKTPTELT
jgi:hypothetical protein